MRYDCAAIQYSPREAAALRSLDRHPSAQPVALSRRCCTIKPRTSSVVIVRKWSQFQSEGLRIDVGYECYTSKIFQDKQLRVYRELVILREVEDSVNTRSSTRVGSRVDTNLPAKPKLPTESSPNPYTSPLLTVMPMRTQTSD